MLENSSSNSGFDGGYPRFFWENKNKVGFFFVFGVFYYFNFLILAGFRKKEREAQQNSDVPWP